MPPGRSSAQATQMRKTGWPRRPSRSWRARDYPTALARGWPIATGVIEGACRWLVKGRMDITGARWGLDGAEAILKLRALIASGDFDEYWPFHLRQEHQRVHRSRYSLAA